MCPFIWAHNDQRLLKFMGNVNLWVKEALQTVVRETQKH